MLGMMLLSDSSQVALVLGLALTCPRFLVVVTYRVHSCVTSRRPCQQDAAPTATFTTTASNEDATKAPTGHGVQGVGVACKQGSPEAAEPASNATSVTAHEIRPCTPNGNYLPTDISGYTMTANIHSGTGAEFKQEVHTGESASAQPYPVATGLPFAGSSYTSATCVAAANAPPQLAQAPSGSGSSEHSGHDSDPLDSRGSSRRCTSSGGQTPDNRSAVPTSLASTPQAQSATTCADARGLVSEKEQMLCSGSGSSSKAKRRQSTSAAAVCSPSGNHPPSPRPQTWPVAASSTTTQHKFLASADTPIAPCTGTAAPFACQPPADVAPILKALNGGVEDKPATSLPGLAAMTWPAPAPSTTRPRKPLLRKFCSAGRSADCWSSSPRRSSA